jgi:hypothetical protein
VATTTRSACGGSTERGPPNLAGCRRPGDRRVPRPSVFSLADTARSEAGNRWSPPARLVMVSLTMRH